jgi:hypothetical protein
MKRQIAPRNRNPAGPPHKLARRTLKESGENAEMITKLPRISRCSH